MSRDTLPIALLAEADDETRFLIKSLLELQGFVVIEAQDADDAYALAECYKPDLILLEMLLPVARNFSAVRRLKKDPVLRKVPIIALSTRDAQMGDRLARAAGCSAHVEKPIDFDRLEAVVESLIPCERLSMVSLLVH